MTRLYGVMSQAFGSLAVAALVVGLAAATANSAFADTGPGPGLGTCDHPNGQACTDNDTTNPTDCDTATKGKACDSQDTNCKCRFGSVSLKCACGY